jgi:3-methyladenine DNA glycosylase AlkD
MEEGRMKVQFAGEVGAILAGYDPKTPRDTAEALQILWLRFEPKSMAGIKAEQRAQQKTVGIRVAVLKSIGNEVGKAARRQVDDYIPLARLLWDEYGREGRVVAVMPLGSMELADPEKMLPLLLELSRSCLTWEDADQFAMNALEPIVRKAPETWLPVVEPWLSDENKWVRRIGVIVVGRLPMKHPAYTTRCVALAGQLIFTEDVDVKKGTSFAIRLCARGETAPVRDFLARHVPPADPAATWVLCDAIRSMARKLLPDFVTLLPLYEAWAADPTLTARDRRSVESAVRALRKVQGSAT